ncbi:hypothetical protein VKT23_018792 [Stygiomarasmius scandens]|uniref:Uncharacterized protein n=1 Tax=Marasmiellus scandens TaxID=2682957 RepID=A0ABR1IN08_9AGAR
MFKSFASKVKPSSFSRKDATLAQAVHQPYTYQQDAGDIQRIQEENRRRKEEAYLRRQEAAVEAEARRQEIIRARCTPARDTTRKMDERRAKLLDRLAEDPPLERRPAIKRKPGSSDGYTSNSSSTGRRVQHSSKPAHLVVATSSPQHHQVSGFSVILHSQAYALIPEPMSAIYSPPNTIWPPLSWQVAPSKKGSWILTRSK